MLEKNQFIKYISLATAMAIFGLGFPTIRAAIANDGQGHIDLNDEKLDANSWGELSPYFPACQFSIQQSSINLEEESTLNLENLNELKADCPNTQVQNKQLSSN